VEQQMLLSLKHPPHSPTAPLSPAPPRLCHIQDAGEEIQVN